MKNWQNKYFVERCGDKYKKQNLGELVGNGCL